MRLDTREGRHVCRSRRGAGLAAAFLAAIVCEHSITRIAPRHALGKPPWGQSPHTKTVCPPGLTPATRILPGRGSVVADAAILITVCCPGRRRRASEGGGGAPLIKRCRCPGIRGRIGTFTKSPPKGIDQERPSTLSPCSDVGAPPCPQSGSSCDFSQPTHSLGLSRIRCARGWSPCARRVEAISAKLRFTTSCINLSLPLR